ncbi:MAG: type II toxin-antitoxin system mRNA interferase toxin, RelE/StbE family [bacterium]|nr:type II toxin-antitoxin system mRNA interferase toxin, RelE/StbE family [bacterium]
MPKFAVNKIDYSSYFARALGKLTPKIQQKFIEKEKIFMANAFDARLRTHKLHGKYKNHWSFSVCGSCRVMFAITGKEAVEFINIGDHDIYN